MTIKNKRIKVAKGMSIKCAPMTGATQFEYKVNREISCSFSLLCEVGQAWKEIYEAYLEREGIVIDTIELDKNPYLANILIQNGETK